MSAYHPKNMLKSDDFCYRGAADILNSDTSTLMLAMKFAYHLATYEDVLLIHKKLKEKMPYKLLDISEKMPNPYNTKLFRPFILQSSKQPMKFAPVLTNNGLCYGWNAKRLDYIYKKSIYMDLFISTFGNKHSLSSIQSAALKTVTFYLDRHDFYLKDRANDEKSFGYEFDMSYIAFSYFTIHVHQDISSFFQYWIFYF